jgi:four helix bundle protein
MRENGYAGGGKSEALKKRTKQFSLRVLTLFRSLPQTDEASILGKQLLRSGTSVGANYRAVCRARSRKEFVAKMGIVVEEADETLFWMELLVEGGIVSIRRLGPLMTEGEEVLAIFAASLETAKRNCAGKRENNESMIQ